MEQPGGTGRRSFVQDRAAAPSSARTAAGRVPCARNGTPDAGRAARDGGPAYAAIDLGTTNCRLLVAHPGPDGPRVVDSFSRVVRLGEGLARNRRLSEPAMHRAVSALRVCAKKLRGVDLAGLRAVSTAACRQADNGESFLKRAAA